MTSSTPSLAAITIMEGNGSFIVKYELDGSIPRAGTLLLGFQGVSADGETIRQFGIKFQDGESVGYFVFDHVAVKQENFEYIPAGENKHLILTPYEATPYTSLGRNPKLRGHLNYNGDDVQTDIPVQISSSGLLTFA